MSWWRIGLQEGLRQGTRMDPKVLAGMVVLGLAVGALFAFAAPPAPNPENGLWIVETTPGSYFEPAARSESRFRVFEGDGQAFEEGRADMLLQGQDIYVRSGDRGAAAAEIMAVAVRQWIDEELRKEPDQAAAFPLIITMAYEPRVTGSPPPEETPPPSTPSTPATPSEPGPEPGPDPGPSEPPEPQVDILEEVEPRGQVQEDLRPDQVDPPFPIRSLLLTFAYVLPAGLLAQVQAANLHGERTRRRGVMLLSAPVTPGQILVGKSAPAMAATVLLAAIVTIFLGAGWLGFLASLSFLAFLYSATTYLAVISRSPRELSLSQVMVTTLLNVFLFLPAMFPSIPPVAFLSPIHVVASGVRGDAVTMGQFLYATLPLTFAAIALAALSIGLLREELLFSVRSSISRLLDALAAVTRKHWKVLVAGILVVPFVFAAEIMVFVTSSVMGLEAALIIFLALSVVVEEAAKGLPIWARHRPGARGPVGAWVIGPLVGLGFFLGEKSYLVLTLVGFQSLPGGPAALAVLGTGPGLLILTIPLALHVVTATIMALGSIKGRVWARLSFLASVILHYVYDRIIIEVAS